MPKLFTGQQGNMKYYSYQQADCSCTKSAHTKGLIY